MKITRIAALSVILASTASSALMAQGLSTRGAPAEVPPSSYTAKQYVDSRGCVYIRAGIDGAVTWVPRVDRARKHICGQQPSNVAGSGAPAPRQVRPVELITVAPTDTPPVSPEAAPVRANAAATAKTKVPAVRPNPLTRPKPKQVVRTQIAPATTAAKPVRVKPAPIVVPQPVTTPTRQIPQTVPGTSTGRTKCPGASELSQRYINQTGDVRCGPQQESPLSALRDGSSLPTTSVLPAGTRVLPAHVYRERLAARGIEVPKGYRPVWQDGRLNQRRAERSLQPSAPQASAAVPSGFVRVDRNDDRLNPMRGIRTDNGDAQMAVLWENRRGLLVEKTLPLDRPVYRAQDLRAGIAGQAGYVARRAVNPAVDLADTADTAAAPRRYVKAAAFGSRADALAAANALRRQTGLAVRLGTSQRADAAHRHIVLAGPFYSDAAQALIKVRAAGHPAARLSK